MQARAAILVRTLSLVNGNSRVRLSVVEAFVNVLNSGTTPPQVRGASYDKEVLHQLADTLAGECTTLHQPDYTGDSCILSSYRVATADTATLAAKQSLIDPDSNAGTGAASLLEPPGISAEERTVLEAGQSASAGIGALVVAAGRSSVSAASAVAALSSEALQALVQTYLPGIELNKCQPCCPLNEMHSGTLLQCRKPFVMTSAKSVPLTRWNNIR